MSLHLNLSVLPSGPPRQSMNKEEAPRTPIAHLSPSIDLQVNQRETPSADNTSPANRRPAPNDVASSSTYEAYASVMDSKIQRASSCLKKMEVGLARCAVWCCNYCIENHIECKKPTKDNCCCKIAKVSIPEIGLRIMHYHKCAQAIVCCCTLGYSCCCTNRSAKVLSPSQ